MGTEFSRTSALSHLDSVDTYNDELAKFRLDVLKATLFKKFVGSQYDAQALEAEAFGRFIANNQLVSQIPIDCDSKLVRYVASEMHTLYADVFSLGDALQYAYCGPGASVASAETDFFSKMFDSPLSHTSSKLLRIYRQTISAPWYLAESLRDRLHGSLLVPGSRLCSVPKDEARRRVICTEPTLNMFFQLGAKHYLESGLMRGHNIDLSNQQDINKDLARQGSRSQRFVTLDLKDASDRISLQLCKAILPGWLFDLLCSIRSPRTSINGEWHDLSMISTMGNGTTFPLMTAIISCIIRSVYHMHGIQPKNGKNYAVFGDDIIVTTDVSQDVIDSLHALGFLVNTEKSFVTGPFRESCGGDYLNGHDVRGVYIKALNNESDYYSAINRLFRWSVIHGIDLSGIISYFLEFVQVRTVPGHSNDNAGILTPGCYNTHLKRDRNGAVKYLALEAKAFRRPVTKLTNEAGSIISFIGGYIEGTSREGPVHGYITSRQTNVRYKVQRRVTPHWDAESNFSLGWFNNQEFIALWRKSLDLRTMRRLESLLA